MLARLGFPAPRLATKLYCALGFFLACVCALAFATVQFAGETEAAISRLRTEGLANVASAGRLQVLLEQHRRLVAVAALSGGDSQREQLLRDVGNTIGGIADGIALDRDEKLSARFALLASYGAAVFDLARDGNVDEARAAASRYSSAADGFALDILAESNRRSGATEAALGVLAEQARSLITSVSAGVALIGLVVGPLGLFFLRRMRTRLEAIATALIRLSRNDTSVDIQGVNAGDEFGQLARSVSVFKAKSIELLNRKADFERLNLQLDAAINHMPLGLSMFDANERLLVCNRRYADMYDLPSDLTRPGTVHCALWEHRTRRGARHSETRDGAIGDGRKSASMQIDFVGGRTISVTRQPLRGGGWVSLHEDVTERKRQEEKITHLARHDPLTGLANRVLFREQLEQSLARLVRGQGFAVMCLDLDHFKAVNDTLGHPVGDALLKQVSQRLLACVRHGDLVARLGGDEFAIIQASVRDPTRTESLAARIVETVGAPYDIDGQRIEIGTSIGITLAPRDGESADQLLKNADLALYRAKAAGRGGYAFFVREMSEEIESRRVLEADLRQALAEDELELIYEPMVCLASGRVLGAEAMPQWQHRVHGTISSAELSVVAEEVGLVTDLGDWVMRQACAQAARWPVPAKVAIKVSPLQFARRSVMESVLQALAQSGLPPRRLELELPEAAVLQENSSTLAMLHQLRQLGVRIAMDDFGTGYGSLASLRAFPFDTIKIDKALIADVDRRDGSRAVVEAIISLGTSLGMTTLAEGVENHEQLAKLRGWRCTQGQGYFLGPMRGAGEIASALTPVPAATQLPDLSRASGGSDEPPASSRAA
jgi:diguanylate cyclase (GGDEF)-like protein